MPVGIAHCNPSELLQFNLQKILWKWCIYVSTGIDARTRRTLKVTKD